MGSILIVPKFFMFLIPNECKNEVSFSFFFEANKSTFEYK